jgi:hypothetical protein
VGAIYISPERHKIPDAVFNIFRRKGFNNSPIDLTIAGKRILLYGKQLLNIQNHIRAHGAQLLVVGTCFYQHLPYERGLEQILSDFINQKFNTGNLIGNYFIIIHFNDQLYYFIDPLFHQSIFIDIHSGILTSSFLACVVGAKYGNNTKRKVNKKALTETLVTGNLIGSETLIEDIYRLEKSTEKLIDGILKLHDNAQPNASKKIKTLEEAVDFQLCLLNSYFEAIRPNLELLRGVTGLTGGFDSRLLLMSMIKNNIVPKVYINAKSNRTTQYDIANRICQVIGIKLFCPSQDIEPCDIKENFYFNDGLIRIYQIWTETVKSRHYLESIYEKGKIGFSGIGGEQYRNSDYLLRPEYNFEEWIEAELLMKFSINTLINRKQVKDLVNYISNKITNEFTLKKDEKISFSEIKQIQNRLFNNANRTLKNNIDNQLVFFLSPFIEARISSAAYDIVEFLGEHHQFEKMMLEKIGGIVNQIELDYGYTPNKSVPQKYLLIGRFKWLVGIKLFNFIQQFLKKKIVKSNQLSMSSQKLKKLYLPINFELLKQNELLAPLIIEAEIFLNEMEEYIDLS